MAGYVERLVRDERVRSNAAIWSQRLAGFAVPFLLIIVLGHRFGAIQTVPTFWLLGVAVIIVLAALVAGWRGLYELWSFGNKGGMASARGLALAMILLVPFLYQGAKAFTLPRLYDISTDLEDAPTFDTALDDRGDAMNPIVEPSAAVAVLQIKAYPSVTARRYPLGVSRVFREVVNLVGDRGWTILAANTLQGEAKVDEDGSGLVAKPVADAKGTPLRPAAPKPRPSRENLVAENSQTLLFETQTVLPTGRVVETDLDGATIDEQEERYVEAVATSLLFGFESDVVFRLVEDEDGTLVDMRSASRWGPHDLGANAKRILEFMKELDLILQGAGTTPET